MDEEIDSDTDFYWPTSEDIMKYQSSNVTKMMVQVPLSILTGSTFSEGLDRSGKKLPPGMLIITFSLRATSLCY